MAKHIVVYHDHCNDGFGAAFIAHQALSANLAEGDEIVLVPASYGKPLDAYDLQIHRHDTVHILDFSFPVPELLNICELAVEVIWLDHHKTAIDAWTAYCSNPDAQIPDNLTRWLSDNYSGALLAWVHYHDDGQELCELHASAPHWVKLIDDRDRWIFQYPQTKAFHAGTSLYPRTIDNWKVITDPGAGIIEEGNAVLRYQDQLYEQLMETAHEITIDGIKGLAANVPGQFASDMGHLLCKKSGTFGCTYSSDGRGYKFSIRSAGDFDVSAIAKKFGGGGHKNAAGFAIELPIDIAASGLTLWSQVDELTTYAAEAGASDA